MQLKIKPEFFKLVPRPQKEQYEALKESISRDGLLYPKQLETLKVQHNLSKHPQSHESVGCVQLNKKAPE